MYNRERERERMIASLATASCRKYGRPRVQYDITYQKLDVGGWRLFDFQRKVEKEHLVDSVPGGSTCTQTIFHASIGGGRMGDGGRRQTKHYIYLNNKTAHVL